LIGGFSTLRVGARFHKERERERENCSKEEIYIDDEDLLVLKGGAWRARMCVEQGWRRQGRGSGLMAVKGLVGRGGW